MSNQGKMDWVLPRWKQLSATARAYRIFAEDNYTRGGSVHPMKQMELYKHLGLVFDALTTAKASTVRPKWLQIANSQWKIIWVHDGDVKPAKKKLASGKLSAKSEDRKTPDSIPTPESIAEYLEFYNVKQFFFDSSAISSRHADGSNAQSQKPKTPASEQSAEEGSESMEVPESLESEDELLSGSFVDVEMIVDDFVVV